MKFTKFLRTPIFLQNISYGCFWKHRFGISQFQSLFFISYHIGLKLASNEFLFSLIWFSWFHFLLFHLPYYSSQFWHTLKWGPETRDPRTLGLWDLGLGTLGPWNWDPETWDSWLWTWEPYNRDPGNGTLRPWDLQLNPATDCINFICEANFDNKKPGHLSRLRSEKT